MLNLMNQISVTLISISSKAVILFDVAWLRESEVDEEEAVYQEDRFGVPVAVLRYETKSSVKNINTISESAYAVDPSVPF